MRDIILITGASSDIGIGLIKQLDNQSLVLAHCHNSEDRFSNLLKNKNKTIVPIKADFSSEDEILSFLDSIETQYGVPNKIIHLVAPQFEHIRFKKASWKDFQTQIEIGIKSFFMITNRFLPTLAKRKEGKVVCMLTSFIMGVPPKTMSHYITGKYALLGIMRALASEYADKNIQINGIAPSMVETRFLDHIDEKIIELSAQGHPLKRNAAVEDIVPIIKMLISQDSDYMNGVVIPITGGSIF